MDMEFDITEESAAEMPTKGIAAGADLYEEARKVVQSLIPHYGLVAHGAEV
jgi:hypothetical protein